MVAYVPFEDINPFQSSSEVIEAEVDKFHLLFSTNSLSFNKVNQEKTVLVKNVGWEKVPFNKVTFIGAGYIVTHALPSLLLPGENYPITIERVSGGEAGLYLDTGNSYGDKFLHITVVI